MRDKESGDILQIQHWRNIRIYLYACRDYSSHVSTWKWREINMKYKREKDMKKKEQEEQKSRDKTLSFVSLFLDLCLSCSLWRKRVMRWHEEWEWRRCLTLFFREDRRKLEDWGSKGIRIEFHLMCMSLLNQSLVLAVTVTVLPPPSPFSLPWLPEGTGRDTLPEAKSQT